MLKAIKIFLDKLLKIERFWLFTAITTLLFSIVFFALGRSPKMLGILDYSWAIALHEFFASKKQFGTEIIFTYGPYGFLSTKSYHPETYLLTCLAWLFFALVFWWGSLLIAYKLIKNKILIFLWFFSIFFICADPNLPDNIFAYFYLFFLLHNLYIKDPILPTSNIVLVTTIALISLIKFSFFSLSIPIIGLITIKDIFDKKKPVHLITFISVITALWLAAGQNLLNFPSYVKNSLEMAYHYNFAMTSPYIASPYLGLSSYIPPLIDCISVIYFSIFLFFLIILTNWQKEKTTLIFWGLSLLFFTFIIIKMGYGRLDSFHLFSNILILFIISIFFLILSFEQKEKSFTKIFSIISVLLLLSLVQSSLKIYLNTDILSAIANNFYLIPQHTKEFWLVTTGKTDLQKEYKLELEEVKNLFPIENLNGSVDVNSDLQIAAIANKLNYKPRPIFQGHSVHSSSLSEINAKYFRNTPPNYLLFSSETIDARFPTLDDSLSWLEFLTKYEIKDISQKSDFLILQSKPQADTYNFSNETTTDTTFNQEIAIPKIDQGVVWAKIEIDYSILGKIFSAIYKPMPLYLNVTTKQNKKYKYFLPSFMAKTGFLLSPLIKDKEDFAKLFTEEWMNNLDSSELKSLFISLGDEEYLWQFSPKIKFSFSHLSFPRKNSLELKNTLVRFKNDKDTTKLMALGLEQLKKEDYINAIITSESILELSPNKNIPTAYNNMGSAFLALSLVEEAINTFEKATKLYPYYSQAKTNLDYLQSIKQKAIDPNTKAKNYGYLADGYLSLGKAEKASLYYEKALILNPDNANFYNNLSVAYFQLGLWDKAIFASQEGLRLNPNLDSAKNILKQSQLKTSDSLKKTFSLLPKE
jgi:tetratricopeptide (TPR) repeat protein